MSERVAIHVHNSHQLLGELQQAHRTVATAVDGLSPLVREASVLLNRYYDHHVLTPLESVETGLQTDHHDLQWRVDYLIDTDLRFDLHGRELANLPADEPTPITENAWIVARELAQLIDTYRDADGDQATLADLDAYLDLLRAAEHDPRWLASVFRYLGAERTFELSVAISSFAIADASADGLTADLLQMRADLATSLAIASTATFTTKQGERTRTLDQDWFDDLWHAANVAPGYVHDNWVDLFDTDQPFHRDVAVHLGIRGLELIAGDLQGVGVHHEFHLPELDMINVSAHVRSNEELAAPLLRVAIADPAGAAGTLLTEGPGGRRGVDMLADRSFDPSPDASILLAELAMAGTVGAQQASILDGTIVHGQLAEQALHATGSLIEAISDAEANHPSEDPYNLIRAAGLANVVIATLPHALRVETTGQGVYILATDGPIPSSSAGVEVDPIDLSYAFGSLFRHDELRVAIGGHATIAARELLLEDPSLENHGAVGMINAVLINGLNRAGIQDAAAQQRAVDEFNDKANEIWGNATFAISFLPGGKKVVTIVSQGENVLEFVGVDLKDAVINAAQGQFGPPDPTISEAQASVAATQNMAGASRAANQVILAVAFERLQAELRSGTDVTGLDPTSRAILHHIENSVLAEHFEPGSTSFAEFDSPDQHHAVANLANSLDHSGFDLELEMHQVAFEVAGTLRQTGEFAG